MIIGTSHVVVVVATQSGGGAYGPIPVGGKRSCSICSSSAHCAQLDCLPRYGVLDALKVRSGPGMTIWEIVLTYDSECRSSDGQTPGERFSAHLTSHGGNLLSKYVCMYVCIRLTCSPGLVKPNPKAFLIELILKITFPRKNQSHPPKTKLSHSRKIILLNLSKSHDLKKLVQIEIRIFER